MNVQDENTEESKRSTSFAVWVLLGAFIIFFVWASIFELDQFVRAPGQVISSSRVQIIQTVDGGVVSEINVAEGDVVEVGQILAKIDDKRFSAQTNEIKARVSALSARVARLRAEVSGSVPKFSEEMQFQNGAVALELSIYEQRLKSFHDQISTQERLLKLAVQERDLLTKLATTGDIAKTEIVEVEKKVLEAEFKLETVKNDFYEQSGEELSKVEKDLAENLEIFQQRQSILESAVLKAQVRGVVKNLTVTTIGAVTRAGEELMQIVPLDDQLLVEVRVPPVDIGDLKTGLPATLRFEPFDSSIYGTVPGNVVFISADTLKESNARGEENKYYAMRVAFEGTGTETSIGKTIEVIPGMTAQVDIKTGKRTVLQYILKPVVKTLTGSFGEK